MNESSNDNWNQEPGSYGNQQQPPQQQPPQQQPYPGPQGVPPRKKNTTPIIIGIIAVVAIIGIVVALLVFTGGSSLEGRWNADYMEFTYEDSFSGETETERETMDGWIEFNSDGTGVDDEGDSFEWEDLGGGKIRITDSYGTHEMSYNISGSTLTLSIEDTYNGETVRAKMVFQRA